MTLVDTARCDATTEHRWEYAHRQSAAQSFIPVTREGAKEGRQYAAAETIRCDLAPGHTDLHEHRETPVRGLPEPDRVHRWSDQ